MNTEIGQKLQPITTAPKDGTEVLLVRRYNGLLEYHVAHYRKGDKCWQTSWGLTLRSPDPLYWMLLPVLPDNKEDI